MARQRLDTLLVKKGLAESRSKAQALILAGEVIADGKVFSHPAMLVTEKTTVQLLEKPLYVSRGGIKLISALEQFNLDVAHKIAIDVGSSTGGFTDCLLQRGVSRVYAIDVGYGQLDYRLRNDQRVAVMERVNARYPFFMPEKADLATIDLSFISAEKVIPNITRHLKKGGSLILLLKPQFEAGREEVGRGGVVKNPQVHARVLGHLVAWAVSRNFRLGGLIPSPILGPAGNREFLIWLRCPEDTR
ncbi:TlyA family RNA methyltransferase [Chloroflexota bacterium]